MKNSKVKTSSSALCGNDTWKTKIGTVKWHVTGNLISIQITSRMFHVEFGWVGGIVCIFVKIVMLIWRSHFYLSLQGGLLGKALLRVQLVQT